MGALLRRNSANFIVFVEADFALAVALGFSHGADQPGWISTQTYIHCLGSCGVSKKLQSQIYCSTAIVVAKICTLPQPDLSENLRRSN